MLIKDGKIIEATRAEIVRHYYSSGDYNHLFTLEEYIELLRFQGAKIIDNFKEKGQLCWTCKNACNSGCSWSRELKPVEGWIAERCDLNMWHFGNGTSYRVYSCPEYVNDQGESNG